jgi:hypothetical protein
MGNVEPSVCLAEAKQRIATDYTGQSSIYVYDPAGVNTGYFSFSINSQQTTLVAVSGFEPVTERVSDYVEPRLDYLRL